MFLKVIKVNSFKEKLKSHYNGCYNEPIYLTKDRRQWEGVEFILPKIWSPPQSTLLTFNIG